VINRSRLRNAGLVIGCGLAALPLAACAGSGLSSASTCSSFLQASPSDQAAIVEQLAAQYNKPDYATPLGEPEVPYACAGRPTMTLAEFFKEASD